MRDQSARLHIKVVPGASNSKVVGWLGEALKVRVAAPPEKGKANAAVEAIVCSTLKLPSGSVSVISGTTSAHKTLEINGLSHEELLERLSTFS